MWRWTASKGLLRKLLFVTIGMIALCATSCKSKALTMLSSHATDSLQTRRRVELTLAPVPHSQAQLTLPLPQIEVLPSGAGYTHQSGQATVKLVRGEGDTIYLTATCDSLQRQYLLLEEELTRIHGETKLQQLPPAANGGPTGWQWFWIRLGQLAVVTLLIRILTKRLRKSNSAPER